MDEVSASGLRTRIELTIGKEISKKYCQFEDRSGPIMLPPIPACTVIDILRENFDLERKTPENAQLKKQTAADKKLQDGFEAEMKVYRVLEDLRRNVIILHQLSYTHEQYSTFKKEHLCTKKKCRDSPDHHCCHQNSNETKANIEGETDFVVMGEDFVAVLEVKGLRVPRYVTCCSELISECSVRKTGFQRLCKIKTL